MVIAPTVRFRLACCLCALLVGAVQLRAWTRSQPAAPPPMAATTIRFADVTVAAGVSFTHNAGGSGRYYYPEQLGGGAAWLDYDGDGWLDLFLAQGAPLDGYSGPDFGGSALYRNAGDGTFTDVTAPMAVPRVGYALGIASGDYDGDADPDLVVTTIDGTHLLRNERRSWTDVTDAAGIRGGQLSTGASFLDYDGDGWLDLFVSRYATYAVENDLGCSESSMAAAMQSRSRSPDLMAGPRQMCGPKDMQPAGNQLFHNSGNGTFTDVSGASGIGRFMNHGFGIAPADYNEDGRVDIFVASDMMPNALFLGRPDGTFVEEALTAGIAVGPQGVALAGMGADTGDYDNDGHLDLFVTNFENETSSLYRGAGDGTFTDQSQRAGVTAATLPFLKWGGRFVDLDRDGWQDLFMVNGHVSQRAPNYPIQMEHFQKGRGYAQRAQILANNGAGRFVEVSTNAGPFFSERRVSRGAAFADYDNDGDTDVLITNINQAPVLLRNDTPAPARWARVVVKGTRGNPDAIGAQVRVTAGGITQTQVVKSGGSYLSDHDRRLLFGLPGTGPITAEVRWPCGRSRRLALEPNKTTTIGDPGCPTRTPSRSKP